MKIDVAEVRAAAQGRWLEIIPRIAPGLFEEAIENLGNHVRCPFHGGEGDFRFIRRATQGRKTTAEVGAAMCTCGRFSDGFALLQQATGKSFYGVLKEVAEYVQGVGGQPKKALAPIARDAREESAQILQKVQALWSAGRVVDLTGDSVPYYQVRGVTPDVLADVQDVRFMASLGYFTRVKGEVVKVGSFPALLALMRSPSGETAAVHRTWLSQARTQKAPVDSPKKLSESPGVAGAAIRLFDARNSDTLGITEGIETALAVRQLAKMGHWPELGNKIPVWACFAERNIRSFVPPAELTGLRRIVVFADNDERGTGLTAALAFKERMATERPDLQVVIQQPAVVGWDWLDALVNLGQED